MKGRLLPHRTLSYSRWEGLRCPSLKNFWKVVLGLAKSQQSVKTSFGKVVCELKATELDFPSSVPKTGLYRQ
jgi:hypothetical protein